MNKFVGNNVAFIVCMATSFVLAYISTGMGMHISRRNMEVP